EGGWPGANPTDTAFFGDPPKLDHATLTAFGMTRRPGRSVGNDPGLAALFEAETRAICLVGKSWDFQVEVALEIPLNENIDLISDSIAEAARRGREPLFDAEHFFDGYKANPTYAMDCLKAAHDAGARWLVLCDTNGGTLPDEIERIVGEVTRTIPGTRLGIHAHNDTENAVANSLAAVRAGVRQVQGTINGLGERCGNANMISLIPSLVLKPTYRDLVDTGISEDTLKRITGLSRLLDETLNRAPQRNAPYVGTSAFAHKGGLHVSAVLKDPRTYEHIDPEKVGNERQILVSDQSGVANIVARLKEIGVEVDPKNPKLKRLLEIVKEREFAGYSYDGAAASFELLARRTLDEVPTYFNIDSFRTLAERRYNAKGELVTMSEATVKLTIDGEEIMSVGEGNGPVNALDAALRKDLGRFSPYIDDLRLVDYKVRILNQGTGDGTNAVTRVMIESADGKGERWFTVGVSPNIVDASFQAMNDSLTYKLYRDGAPPGKN
ncbi:MAG TPA: citramalate synthase, partial [Alphaproteobacteria bacterium]|nr:citramalate synthase [Alphaproteobacteria bacterium]